MPNQIVYSSWQFFLTTKAQELLSIMTTVNMAKPIEGLTYRSGFSLGQSQSEIWDTELHPLSWTDHSLIVMELCSATPPPLQWGKTY